MTSVLFEKTKFTQNRELSWLRFNERVLCEAMDNTVPLLERLKFISIFSSNLDEFFMVRVGSLYDLNYIEPKQIDKKSGMTPLEQMDAIYEAVRPLYLKKTQYYEHLQKELKKHNIENCSFDMLSQEQRKEVKQFFLHHIKPILSPLVISSHNPFPHLENKKIYILVALKLKNKETVGIIPIPSSVPPVLYLKGEGIHYIYTEDILLAYTEYVFNDYEIIEKCYLRVTRNADINFDDADDTYDLNEDFRTIMKSALKKRKRLAPVRLEMSKQIGQKLKVYLYDKLSLSEKSTYITDVPMALPEVFEIGRKLPNRQQRMLEYPNIVPKVPKNILPSESMLKQIRERDILISYPFESIEPFLRFMKEAAEDSAVVSIKITIYRLSAQSKLVEALCLAAENGKDVTVLIELRARFDEQSNIDWSERLEQAGCNLIYGTGGYKVHSKICLISRKEHGNIRYYTQIGTGNYNEKTATQYTDLSLITYHQEIGADANAFFQNIGIANIKGTYNHLLVSPTSLKSNLLKMIEREMKKGKHGRIFIKVNSLTDFDIISVLQKASEVGVQIQLMIRGICCLLPQIDHLTENIQVFNIVGRFLEHSRIYAFGSGSEIRLYISSADFMTRNTERRVEVACPIYAENTRSKILKLIEACQYDNVKARKLLSNGEYTQRRENKYPINSQEMMIENIFEDEVRIQKDTWIAGVMQKINLRLRLRLK